MFFLVPIDKLGSEDDQPATSLDAGQSDLHEDIAISRIHSEDPANASSRSQGPS